MAYTSDQALSSREARARTQVRNAVAGTEAGATGERGGGLLACSYTLQAHLPRDGTAHGGGGSLTSIKHSRKYSWAGEMALSG